LSDLHSDRRAKVLTAIRKEKLPAILVSHQPNVRYLTGFTGEVSPLLLGPDHTLIISDSRFTTQLDNECPGLESVIRTAKTPAIKFLADTLIERKVHKLGIEGSAVSAADFQQLQERLPGVELVLVSGMVETLRQVKDKGEIEALRRAIDLAEVAFRGVQTLFTPDMTELQIAHELEHLMRRRGALRAAFEPIVGVGKLSALPHYRAGGVRLGSSSFVLIDWGAVEPTGYHSDLTRVLSTSKIPPKLEKLYRVVSEAQQAAFRLLKPGAACKDVDAAARKVIADAGFDRYFGHGLGHGIGLEIHEGPRFSPLSEEVLKPGMVMTIEPGIYIPEFGGVRLEDDVLITRDGYERMTSVPWEM
jgi:Xaa-Pro aminopeptidase